MTRTYLPLLVSREQVTVCRTESGRKWSAGSAPTSTPARKTTARRYTDIPKHTYSASVKVQSTRHVLRTCVSRAIAENIPRDRCCCWMMWAGIVSPDIHSHARHTATRQPRRPRVAHTASFLESYLSTRASQTSAAPLRATKSTPSSETETLQSPVVHACLRSCDTNNIEHIILFFDGSPSSTELPSLSPPPCHMALT